MPMASEMPEKKARAQREQADPEDDDAADATLDLRETATDAAVAAVAVTRRMAARAATVVTAVGDAADDLVDDLRPIAEHLAATTRDVAVEGARHVTPHPPRRPKPLPNLFVVHPQARNAPVREMGLLSIPVDEILGTAVEGPAQRGDDFQPLPPFRSKNWQARWQRILGAARRMESLPPIDVLRTRDGYWVTDGHNRVAAAKSIGQLEVDADVKAVVLPGEPAPRPSGSLAPVLAESAHIEAAARGQLSRGTTLGRTVQERDLVHDDPDPDAPR
jgi:hypothetical protein